MPNRRLEKRPFQILLVEDSPTDCLLTRSALDRAGFSHELHIVETGIDALCFLRQEGAFSEAPRPDLILLDLNLPKMSGSELLIHIKGDVQLRSIPVVVLTTSESEDDIKRAYAGHANSYISKPVDMHKFAEAMQTVGEYWFGAVVLPPASEPEPSYPIASLGPPSTRTALRVLIVEDSDTDALILQRSLAQSLPIAPTFERAQRLSIAGEKLKGSSFDAVVLDLGLPDSQGLDTLRFLRKLDPSTPMVVLTGLDDEATGPQALELGAQDYLVKGDLSGAALARSFRYAIERSRVSEQMLEAHKFQVIGQVSKSVAHDFNNLLTIIGNSAGLLRGARGEDAENLLEEIAVAVRRGSMLTRQLLSITQQQAHTREEIDLNALIQEFSRFLSATLGDLKLELELGAAVPRIAGDPADLRQLILNLVLNARDAMPQGGQITVSTALVDSPLKAPGGPRKQPGHSVRLRVTDQGAGVDPTLMERIFEPFFTTKAHKRRPGLGLTTVRNIASEHGGVIEVEALPEGGCAFSVYFPAQPLPNASAQARLGQDSARVSATILVVDDEIAIQRTAARILERDGHRVLVASSGEAALALWEEQRDEIALIVTDLMMPDGMSGKELMEALRERGSQTPIIYTSGYSEDFASSELALIRGSSFIEKPYTPDELRAIVRQALVDTQPAA